MRPFLLPDRERLDANARLQQNVVGNIGHRQLTVSGEDKVGVSAISLAEIVYPEEKQRLAGGTFARVAAALADPASSVEEIPVDTAVIQAMTHVPRSGIPDLPERTIAASPVHLGVDAGQRQVHVPSPQSHIASTVLAEAAAYADRIARIRDFPGAPMKREPVHDSATARHVRLFRNGRNQALRIPRPFELPGNQAVIRKEGERLIVEPVKKRSLLALLGTLEPIEEAFPEVDERLPRLDDIKV